jgi:hypothetical protein
VANTTLLPKEVLNERLGPSDRKRCNIAPLLFSAAVFENLHPYLRGDSVLLLCPVAILIRKVNFEQVAACICLFPLLVKGCCVEGRGGESSSHVASHCEGCSQPPQLCKLQMSSMPVAVSCVSRELWCKSSADVARPDETCVRCSNVCIRIWDAVSGVCSTSDGFTTNKIFCCD